MTPEEKLVMAHRYLYYVLGQPVISDYDYDRMEKEVLKHASADSPLHLPGSDSRHSYADDVIKLAMSL